MIQYAEFSPACPVPSGSRPNVLLAHGGGGTLMHELIESVFLPSFGNPALTQRHDGAVIQVGNQRLAFTTDSYVVHPLFFPGGDIGALAVHGTVNDLAMCGARPLCLSAGFIIEEGLAMATLQRVVQSMQRAAVEAGVWIVTGDTKVVDHGKADGLFINTAGIGVVENLLDIAPRQVRPGDVIIVNGDLGRHGMAIMACREGLEFETSIESDLAPLFGQVSELLQAGVEVHCLRDLTRGGLASALNEIAFVAQVKVHLDESSIPVQQDVRSACEILGFDPLYVACEGRFAAFVPPEHSEQTLNILRTQPNGRGARIIGEVRESGNPVVEMTGCLGVNRIVDMLSGEQLPRIC